MTKSTPRPIHNRQGLSSLRRRVGDAQDFYDSQIRALSETHRPGLSGLTTRDPQDFSIALLGAWSAVGDVLSFYQERINDEAYIGTAKERLSLEEIAALVGYRPVPATAAQACLAFEIDDALPVDHPLEFDAGIAVKTLPVETQLPQTFETTEPFRGKSDWNAIAPVSKAAQRLSGQSRRVVLAATSDRPRKGQPVALLDQGVPIQVGPGPTFTRAVTSVADERDGNVVLDLSGTGSASVQTLPIRKPSAPGRDTPNMSSPEAFLADLRAFAWPLPKVVKAKQALGLSSADIAAALDGAVASAPLQPVMFDVRARLFGHNGLRHEDMKAEWPDTPDIRAGSDLLEPSSGKDAALDYLYLDRQYEAAFAGDVVILRGRIGAKVREWALRPRSADTVSVSGFGLSGEVTRLGFARESIFSRIDLRSVEVLTGTRPLDLADVALKTPVAAQSAAMVCAGVYTDLVAGQRVILSGHRADFGGAPVSEVLRIASVELHGAHTELTFETPPQHSYRRDTALLNANIALASHGETVRDVLGSGDAKRSYQSFDLSRGPLTYLPGATASGRSPVIEVHVDGTRWTPVEGFNGLSAKDRAFTVFPTSGGGTRLMFGDGRQGARLPTGLDNIVAVYRVGAGPGGRVGPDQLTLLSRKPLGMRNVRNPLPAFGGSSGEGLEGIRDNAAMHLSTLGRVVSLRDYENFARGFAGIAKAHASWGWRSEVRTACLTVAGDDGQILPDGEGIMPALRQRLQSVSAPGAQATVKPHTPVTAHIACRLFTDPDYRTEEVIESAKRVLLQTFGFASRRLGEPLRATRVMFALQSVPGVLAVDLDRLHRGDQDPALHSILRTERAANGGQSLPSGAELITVSRETLRIQASPVTGDLQASTGGAVR